MEIKVEVDKKMHKQLEEIADEQGGTIDDAATLAFKFGMDIFLASGVPPRAH